MPKLTRRVSEIRQPLQLVEEDIEVRSKKPKTPANDNISMTRDMLKDIVANALEDQERLSDDTSAEAIKAVFTEVMKKGSELQVQPLHSSSIEQDVVHYPVEHSPIVHLKVN